MKLIKWLCLWAALVCTSVVATAEDYPNYGKWDDQLTPIEAVGRFQWLQKWYEGLLIETWERMYDVTDPTSTADKMNDLRNAWLFEDGRLKTHAQYLTFGDEDHENPENWVAGTHPNQVCKTIPRGYQVIGLQTTFDYKPYCAITSASSDYLAIGRVTIGNYENTSDASTYSNFSGRIVTLNRGDSLRVSATELKSHERITGTWHVFADWNRNGALDDAGEMIVRNQASADGEVSFNLNVPDDAAPGFTRLRITTDIAGGYDNPCYDIQYGEVEDYTLMVN